MRELGYVARHVDIFSYLENYQPKGYALSQTEECPVIVPCDEERSVHE